MTQCISRISKVKGILHFAEGRHRFYLEYRCSNNVIANTEKCVRCTDRSTDKIQSSGKYDHGNVNEPIPDHSQMYGGKWYTDGCAKWGVPSSEDIKKAEEHRDAARAEFAAANANANANAIANANANANAIDNANANATIINQEIVSPNISTKRKKRIICPADPTPTTTAPIAPTAPIASIAPTAPIAALAPQPRKRVIKPKMKNEIIIPVEYKSIIATHIENDIEELCTDDYEVEYVPLIPFEHNDISYFREPVKNKLFERKNKTIGAYIGRYDSYTDTIRTDIPDSDSED
jgi:hypothetical protein